MPDGIKIPVIFLLVDSLISLSECYSRIFGKFGRSLIKCYINYTKPLQIRIYRFVSWGHPNFSKFSLCCCRVVVGHSSWTESPWYPQVLIFWLYLRQRTRPYHPNCLLFSYPLSRISWHCSFSQHIDRGFASSRYRLRSGWQTIDRVQASRLLIICRSSIGWFGRGAWCRFLLPPCRSFCTSSVLLFPCIKIILLEISDFGKRFANVVESTKWQYYVNLWMEW